MVLYFGLLEYLIIYFQHSAIHFTIFSNSSSLRLDPLGKHNPVLNNSSDTPLVYDGASANTGCKCIGFHNGLDSIFSPSSFFLISSRVIPPLLSESIRIVVSHLLLKK